ncbi:hypothetical protein AAXB25_14405 [Paenibacillus lautus]|uniref:hypothetical protein n=1 Tax=Paenibacillus lautus TaxID=1401 RepID=UPI003D283314
MIVIEGKAGKSRVLQDIINNKLRNRSVTILDIIGIRALRVPEGVSHMILQEGTTVEDAIDIFHRHHEVLFSQKDWIIFEVNANILDFDLDIFKAMDRRFEQNFIVTVQNDALDEVDVYYV